MRSGLTVLRVLTVCGLALLPPACDLIDPGGPQIAKPGIVHRPVAAQVPSYAGRGGVRIGPQPAQMRTLGVDDATPTTEALLPDVDAPTVADPEFDAMRRRAEERARALERTFDEIKRRIDAENGG